jgi:hypothetical protein
MTLATQVVPSLSQPCLISLFHNRSSMANKLSYTSSILLMIKFSNTMLYRIYPIKSDIFIKFQNLGVGSKPDISDLGWIYPMYQTYPANRQVPKPWHGLQVRYIRPRADISDASDISDLWSGSRTVAAGFGRIYPTSIRYIRLDQNQHSWICNLRAKTRRFEHLMCFEA